MNRLAAAVLAMLCFAAVFGAARAQDYPSHPIKLILSQPRGGGAVDTIARTLADRLSELHSLRPSVTSNCWSAISTPRSSPG
jgi:tripartite-type tricarboxylate transporter receptor subunit TctC